MSTEWSTINSIKGRSKQVYSSEREKEEIMERDFDDLIYSSVFATNLKYGENNHTCFYILGAKQKQKHNHRM